MQTIRVVRLKKQKKAAKKVAIGVGKRKKAVARANIKEGTGVVRINSKLLETYQPEMYQLKIQEPLLLAGDRLSKINIDVNVSSGGFASQADAARTAIANAIVTYFKDTELEKEYRKYDRTLIVGDSRQKEAKKPLGPGARSKKQKSYR